MALIEREIDTAEWTKRIIRDSVTGTYNHLKSTWENLYAQVWHNPCGLTPQQVLDLVGTDAAELFAFSYYAGELLNQAGAGLNNAPPEGVTYTINADGSVTLG